MEHTTSIHGPVRNRTELKHRIMQLNSMKEDQEITLREDLKEIYYSLRFSTLIKTTVRDLSEDTELKGDALKATLNVGTNFLLDKIMLRKGVGIKRYLVNAGLKKIISYFISKNKLNFLQKTNKLKGIIN